MGDDVREEERCSINISSKISMISADVHYAIESMFDKIISDKRAFFRHQQKNEPNLNDSEKLSILREMYDKKPSSFLVRYEKFLNYCDAQFFVEAARLDADVDFICKRLFQNTTNDKVRQQNRRYVQLKRILNDKQNHYFSDKEMRKRNPLMYDRMVGRFQSKQELTEVMHNESSLGSSTLSSALLDMIDNQEVKDCATSLTSIISEKKRCQIFDEKMSEMEIANNDGEQQSTSSVNEEEREGSIIRDYQNENSRDAKDRRNRTDFSMEFTMKSNVSALLKNGAALSCEPLSPKSLADERLINKDGDSYTEKEMLRLEEQDEQDRYFSDESV
uniref:CCD97-like C-terminal domain-containing protein n=1 Tax=Romanomermis culicivorax TaxID=13658 RepID=A0A915JWC3_ROMCU